MKHHKYHQTFSPSNLSHQVIDWDGIVIVVVCIGLALSAWAYLMH